MLACQHWVWLCVCVCHLNIQHDDLMRLICIRFEGMLKGLRPTHKQNTNVFRRRQCCCRRRRRGESRIATREPPKWDKPLSLSFSLAVLLCLNGAGQLTFLSGQRPNRSVASKRDQWTDSARDWPHNKRLCKTVDGWLTDRLAGWRRMVVAVKGVRSVKLTVISAAKLAPITWLSYRIIRATIIRI